MPHQEELSQAPTAESHAVGLYLYLFVFVHQQPIIEMKIHQGIGKQHHNPIAIAINVLYNDNVEDNMYSPEILR